MGSFVNVLENLFRSKGIRRFFCRFMIKCERKAVNNFMCRFTCWYIAEHMYDILFRGSVYVYL